MNHEKLFAMPWSKLYPFYVAKALKKGRQIDEVNALISWLLGYQVKEIKEAIVSNISVKDFFAKAPLLNANAHLITGTICGVKIQDITDQTMKRIRILDKLIDELAKGRPLNRIIRD